ncbi:MAG: uroporphyrinogen-III C-methyltransferase [Rhodocyclaceae bacterium]|nr:uroporphyrinogen-III C-methyltransferase [Rhodocyclaceae bacterium]MCA3073316.1 uroporphyrinogen-III C-methyltransferase [Rhodocyclaceae bacterium]MCA3091356.1 uroporphyrinogen-III C-methyltransferase [Rhodocyclaceae bacterium]MCA3094165.1 uroporphyrinogen-III C-methyltransferase [Rhodocyclaceae bacterium]MCA3098339.1 uroporphyrinogen-III C-methyltransferase [Rhodocyclaceae bacterium]
MSRLEPTPGAIDPLAARPANEAEAEPGPGAPPATESPIRAAPVPASGTSAGAAGEPAPSPLPLASVLAVSTRNRDIALGVLGAAVALLGFLAWDGHRDRNALRQELAQRLAGADDLGRQTQAMAQGAQRTVREMEVALDAVQSQLAESQSQQLALEALYQDLARGRDEAALAEIEQTLIAANQQLVLAGNVRVALIALQSADARLALIDRAQFAPLRRALAADIERLQRVPLVDTTGIAMRLDRAVTGIDTLATLPGGTSTVASAREEGRPGGDSRSPDATSSTSASTSTSTSAAAAANATPAVAGWRVTLARIWAEFKADFRQLASIRRIDPDVLPLISPEQSWFLRENLRLRLLSARHALLARDEPGFRGDIAASRAWVARYFDPRDPATVALAETLHELERAQVRIDLPEIGASIEAVRTLRVSRDRRQ